MFGCIQEIACCKPKKNDMTCADYLFVFYSIQFSIPNCFSYTEIFYDFNVQ